MSDVDRTFTEKEHFALVADAVKREVETATEDAKAQLAELQTKLDRAEAELAAAMTAKQEVSDEFAAYKDSLAAAEEAESRRAERVARVKEIAGGLLADSYFTDERAQRWSAMSDDDFAAAVADIVEVATVALTEDEAALFADLTPEQAQVKLTEIAKARREGAGQRETAAFKGGVTPAAPTKHAARAFLAARGRHVTED